MKKYLKIIIFVAIYLVIMLLIFFKPDTKKSSGKTNPVDNKRKYIILDNYLILEKINDNYREVSFDQGDYLKTKFNIFVNSNYFGEYYYRKMNSEVYLFDDKSDSVSYTGSVIANNYNKNMSICNLVESKLTSNDEEIANKALKKFTSKDIFSPNKMYLRRYDCNLIDNKMSSVYVLNGEIGGLTSEFTLVYYYDGVDVKLISKSNNYEYDLSIKSILNLDEDNELELVIYKSNSSLSCYQLYKYIDGEFKVIKDC